MDEQTYSVVLFKFKGGSEVMYENLSLEEAQDICNDPETSSKTATDPYKYSNQPWFFGYRKD